MHPSWTPLTAGTGQFNGGVWRTPDGEVVKRLVRGPEEPRHHAYWRRQALVGKSGLLERTPGLRAPETLAVEEDAEGLLLWMRWVEPVVSDDLVLAAALGRFADAGVPEPPWGARDVLRLRLQTVARRGGWSSLDGVADDSLLAALNRCGPPRARAGWAPVDRAAGRRAGGGYLARSQAVWKAV